jgi:hypothetical protein
MPQVGEDLPEVVAHSAEHGVLGVAAHALQPVPPELAIRFLMSDFWFDA